MQVLANPMKFYTQGGAALCAGDSGGGAYRYGAGVSRRVVGVASGWQAGTAPKEDPLSYFIALSDSEVAYFLEQWAKRQRDPITNVEVEVKICGMETSLLDCHS
jgi:hypothetical protein